ncbi:hypothetical protein NDU88_004212 [Pleurodeles waltl]|uniref:Uncharacterized protein n=1 Tax=Pleurodeles waltl TaxID=8319 RepID=A0AAV7T850_PLEWA|nr:hypothetical protein NDU88_004212 [Pleurodeles waltl]
MSQDVNPDIRVKKEDCIQTRALLLGNEEEREDADERRKQENGAPKGEKPGTPPSKLPPVETPLRRDQTNVKVLRETFMDNIKSLAVGGERSTGVDRGGDSCGARRHDSHQHLVSRDFQGTLEKHEAGDKQCDLQW